MPLYKIGPNVLLWRQLKRTEVNYLGTCKNCYSYKVCLYIKLCNNKIGKLLFCDFCVKELYSVFFYTAFAFPINMSHAFI
jgi:hypothetical protein